MMFWNAEFVRGLAEGILDRARVIRSGLPVCAKADKPAKAKKQSTKKRPTKKVNRRKVRG